MRIRHDPDLDRSPIVKLSAEKASLRRTRATHAPDGCGFSTCLARLLDEGIVGRVRRLPERPPSASHSQTTCPETCEDRCVAPYSWTVREGSLDGPVVMREYVYDVPDKEPVEGQELYLSNGSGPWRVSLLEKVPEVHRSPYNILVVERVY